MESRISLLVGCLKAEVIPIDVVTRIARSRARHTLFIEKAFLIDDINKEQSKLQYLRSYLVRQMVVAKGFLSKYDHIRFCVYVGDTRYKKWVFERKNNDDRLKCFIRQRFGHIGSAASHVTNL